MREKGKMKKEKKILIRVNKDEKKNAEEMAKAEGKNTSEFFRDLLKQHRQEKLLDKHDEIVKKYEKTLQGFKEVFRCVKKKTKS